MFVVVNKEGDYFVVWVLMLGVVVVMRVLFGEQVVVGVVLMVIESMKFEMVICVFWDGFVDQVYVKDGDSFDWDVVLVMLLQEGC